MAVNKSSDSSREVNFGGGGAAGMDEEGTPKAAYNRASRTHVGKEPMRVEADAIVNPGMDEGSMYSIECIADTIAKSQPGYKAAKSAVVAKLKAAVEAL